MGYIDPGLFGILSQSGLVILAVIVSGFTFFFKPIKNLFGKIFKKQSAPTETTQSPTNPPENQA